MKKYVSLVVLVSITSFTVQPLKSEINSVALEAGALAALMLSFFAYNKLVEEPERKDRKLMYDIALSLASQTVTDDEEKIEKILRSHNVKPTPAIVAAWQTIMDSFDEFASALTRIYTSHRDAARDSIKDIKIDMKALSPKLRKAVAKIRKNLTETRSSRKDTITSSGAALT